MTQRTLAGLVAAVLLVGLWASAAFLPLPYVTYEPGVTVDVLGEHDGKQVIQVEGHPSYRDGGELRMTTVFVSRPEANVNLLQLMHDWISPDDAVYPYDAIYEEGTTSAEKDQENAVQMVSSQDAATAAALTELGYPVTPAVEVLAVTEGAPADGNLEVHDLFQAINGTKVSTPKEVAYLVGSAPDGKPITFEVLRDGRPTTVQVTPQVADGKKTIGIQLGTGFVFPFQVSIDISDSIGGPSAGLMFSLGIYDTLTPGSLTGGKEIAGTGTLDEKGEVGPIGGIQQKIAAARDDGAQLFLVPADNCEEALGAANGDMRLVRVATMHDAVTAIQSWVQDPKATLPACEAAS